jgi:hypothetical protein
MYVIPDQSQVDLPSSHRNEFFLSSIFDYSMFLPILVHHIFSEKDGQGGRIGNSQP